MRIEVNEKLSADLSEQVIHGEQSNKSSVWTMWQDMDFAFRVSNKMWTGMFFVSAERMNK